MTIPVFPSLLGISWPVHRRPSFSNIAQVGVSGRRTSVRQQLEPRWNYEVAVEFARNRDGFNEFSSLLTVYQACYGSFGTFLFNDKSDNTAVDQPIGVGNGTATQFYLLRTLGGFSQRIAGAALNGAVTIKLNGVATTAYTMDANGVITFTSPPGIGAGISWSGAYYWLCRFDEDQLDLSEFADNFWQVSSLKFSTEIITG